MCIHYKKFITTFYNSCFVKCVVTEVFIINSYTTIMNEIIYSFCITRPPIVTNGAYFSNNSKNSPILDQP